MTDAIDTAKPGKSGRGPAFWGISFGLAMAVLAALRIADIVGEKAGFAIMLGCSLLLIPLFRSANRAARRGGCASPAVLRYNRGMGVSSIAYVLGLGTAIWAYNHQQDPGVWTYGLALLPVLPIFGMIWTMGRYLVEETDEYLKYRVVVAALIGLGGLLSIASLWGFLETFELVPHVPGWAAVPVWAIGMGLGQFWIKARGQ
ncbi:hypothetical protein [Novosphingobium beihaiensis]|uniref:Uncharacterized protein n=1 Tax=Novosphingobium beihaiensis TaxID=2930389 RepID=A0ABT0BPY0_9SPHN|nr:hypothetical protein [Novosphingobium beihaiensis]MCJ2187093.1 hypothetical protein [Novosphingobium beihaiensis]